MGTAYLTDAITGVNLARQEEVVAFLVSRNTAFPYDERVNDAPQYPCDLFRFNSLPIFGKTDDGTGVQVDEDQLGVKLALQMSGCANWEEFYSKAILGKGVTFVVKSRTSQSLQERQADARPRNYGLFVIAKDTFMRIKRKVRFNGEKPVRSDASLRREQVAQVMAMYDAFFEMQRAMRGLPTDGQSAAEQILADKRKRLEGLIAATLLEGVTEYQAGADDMLALPMLSRAFGDGHGAMFGRDFMALSRSLGYRGADVGQCNGSDVPQSAEAVEGLSRFLELVWETQRLYFGMRYLNALTTPSMANGQRLNGVDIIESSRQTVETTFLAELARLDASEAVTREFKDIRLQLTRAKAMLAKLEEAYDQSFVKARAATKAAEPPQMVVREVQVVYVDAQGIPTQAEPEAVTASATTVTPEVAPETPTADVVAETVQASKPKRGRKPKAKAEKGTWLKDWSNAIKEAGEVPPTTEDPQASTEASGATEVMPTVTDENQSQAEPEPLDAEALKKKYGLDGEVVVPF